MLTHIDLFSGIGGFALAARWAGIETVQFVEIDKFCQKVLQKNFPGVPIHDDIKTFTNTTNGGRQMSKQKYIKKRGTAQEEWCQQTDRVKRFNTNGNSEVFLLTGGFPCQPFSCAGKRRGKEDDRYLWEEMLRVIKEFKPAWIIGENVNGIRSMEFKDGVSELEGDSTFQEDGNGDYTNVLDGICNSLEEIGYEVQPIIIPACAVNAPHRRDRIWIVANSINERCVGRCGTGNTNTNRVQKSQQTGSEPRSATSRCDEVGNASYTDTMRLQGGAGNRVNGRNEEKCFWGDIGHQNRGASWHENWLEVATRLCRVDDGLPRKLDRVNRLKALGNAIVPQVAYEIMKSIIEVSNDINR